MLQIASPAVTTYAMLQIGRLTNDIGDITV